MARCVARYKKNANWLERELKQIHVLLSLLGPDGSFRSLSFCVDLSCKL